MKKFNKLQAGFILRNSKGFTLIEVLVAAAIFASVLGLVYGLLNSTLISKKELELNLGINQKVKNANEVLQGVVQQANDDFFTDNEFGLTSPPATLPHLFFVSNSYSPPGTGIAPTGWDTAIQGRYLYVKTNNQDKKQIYIFGSDSTTNNFFMTSWYLQIDNAGVKTWKQEQTGVINFFIFQTPANFTITTKADSKPANLYNPSNGELTPMNLYVHLSAMARVKWRDIIYYRQMDQTYIPLVITNPYI